MKKLSQRLCEAFVTNESKEPNQIVIKDFNTWQRTKRPDELKQHINLLYKSGYFNVFKYSKELEDFLKKEGIEYVTKVNESVNEALKVQHSYDQIVKPENLHLYFDQTTIDDIQKSLTRSNEYMTARDKDNTLIKVTYLQHNRYFLAVYVNESVNESLFGDIMKGVKTGSQVGPWTVVVYDKIKKSVKHQEHTSVRDVIPAIVRTLITKFDNDKIFVEDQEGKTVYVHDK